MRRLDGKLVAALCAALAVVTLTAPARAQDITDLPPPQGVGPGLTTGVEQARPYWKGSGPHRWFVGAQLEGGPLYFRPTLQAGYGKPHFEWVGADTATSLTISGTRYYAGLRGVLPNVALRLGFRYESPFQQHYLTRKREYDRFDLEKQGNGRGIYLSSEAELSASWDAPGGNMLLVLSGYHISGVPEQFNVWDINLKQVVEPPWLYRARLGYLYHLGWIGSMRVGGAAEIIGMPLRNTAAVRAGPIVTVSLTHHLQAVAAVMLVARERDSFGVKGADLGQLGLVYRWATGDRFAEFP
jgi:hypothetical protein